MAEDERKDRLQGGKLPVKCPSCSSELRVRSLECPACETRVQGLYPLPVLAKLSTDDQRFILQFVTSSGSLKEMARLLGLSYPTVRNRLDEVIGRLEAAGGNERSRNNG
jgi:hypothetical protein